MIPRAPCDPAEVVETYKRLGTQQKTALALNLTQNAVSRILAKHAPQDVHPPGRREGSGRNPPGGPAEVVETYKRLGTQQKTALALNLTQPRVSLILAKHAPQDVHPRGRRKGQKSPHGSSARSTLVGTPAEIMETYKRLGSQAATAKVHKTSQATISHILAYNYPEYARSVGRPKRTDDREILDHYRESHSVWKTGAAFGCSHEHVRTLVHRLEPELIGKRPIDLVIDEVISLYATDMNTRQIAERFGVHRDTVTRVIAQHARHLMGTKRTTRATPKIDHAEMLALYESGESSIALSRRYGVVPSAILMVIKRKAPHLMKGGGKRCDHAEVIRLLECGFSQLEVAKEMGVSPTTVRNIRIKEAPHLSRKSTRR